MRTLKLSIIAILAFLMSNVLIAQQNDNSKVENVDSVKTLFSKVKITGLYVSPEFQYGQLGDVKHRSIGASAMLKLDKSFALGVNFSRSESMDNTIVSLNTGTRTAGLRAEYTLKPNNLLSVSFPFTVGVGAAFNRNNDDILDGDFGGRDRGNNGAARFVFVQPGVNLDVNLVKNCKLFVGGSYRLTTQVNNPQSGFSQFTTGQLSGLTFQTGLKIGLFNGLKLPKLK